MRSSSPLQRQRQQRQLILQQNTARPHIARVCWDFLANNNVVPLDWSSYSPDLSPIEHLWDDLGRRVRKRQNAQPPSHYSPDLSPIEHMWDDMGRWVRMRQKYPTTFRQLRNALEDEWNNIPMRTINTLVNFIQG